MKQRQKMYVEAAVVGSLFHFELSLAEGISHAVSCMHNIENS